MVKNTQNGLIDAKVAQDILLSIANDKMGGWFDLPYNFPSADLERILLTARKIWETSQVLVCIGIGGSYLGHKAVIEALKPVSPTEVVFAGNSLSATELKNVFKKIEGKDFSLLVISKSGTTLEPAVAFRLLKSKLVEKYGANEAKKRIYAITDANKGTLHDEAVMYEYERFDVPDNLGGRYSVLSAVGLLPMAVAGVNIAKLLLGARDCREKQLVPSKYEKSALLNYAFTRRFLYEHGVKIEVLASFEPSMMYFNEWWKQLFGESEGKNHGGLFPASVIYTTDLHSLGQYMQEGQREILETFIKFGYSENEEDQLVIPVSNQEKQDGGILSLDKLNNVAGKSVQYLNDVAFVSTLKAHDRGGISTVMIELNDEEGEGLTERTLGYLFYFFEVACAVSAKLNGVNPFDQPGVEEYKKEMQKILNEN